MLLRFQTNFYTFTATGNNGNWWSWSCQSFWKDPELFHWSRRKHWELYLEPGCPSGCILVSPWCGGVWVPFLSCQTRVQSQPCGTKLNLCFFLKVTLTNNVELRKSCKCPLSVQVWHLYDKSIMSCCSSFHAAQQREAILESSFWYVSFSSHSSPKMYCQNTELCQCLPAEVWTLGLKPTNQGTGKEITFMCCYWRNYYGLLYRLRCH